eukprot:TRINITY_DN42139_c0_g1_i1.p1 TRINITY_DN42139_c0_g1~~TRINITY_DN42139_c0_g1_i1.p1  ORF type:complete len:524 (-),score=136.62 TRINITY_DN42139_c0_g1_i1:225-1796(-)
MADVFGGRVSDSGSQSCTSFSAAPSAGAPVQPPQEARQEFACSCRRARGPRQDRQRCEHFDRWVRSSGVRMEERAGQYASLLRAAAHGPHALDEKVLKQVRIDVMRTCPDRNFNQAAATGQARLTNVLFAWIVYDEMEAKLARSDGAGEEQGQVGYVQGMSFIALNLLWHAGCEEEAFWVFVQMMGRYDLRSLFAPPDMPGLLLRVFVFKQLLRYSLPELYDHLNEHVSESLGQLLFPWFLSVFSSSVALGPLAEIWDQFFQNGFEAVYRIVLARLRCLKPWLLKETDFTQLVLLITNAHLDFDRVEGRAVPRLRQSSITLPSLTIKAPGNDAAETPQRPKRRDLGPRFFNKLSRLVPHRSSKGAAAGDDDGRVADAAAAGGADEGNGGQGGSSAMCSSWTCQDCDGSQDCLSWLVLVGELALEEKLPLDMLEHFEVMFSREKDRVQGNSDLPVKLRLGSMADFAALEQENSKLRQQNEDLRKRSEQLQKELEDERNAREALQTQLELLAEELAACAAKGGTG